MQRAGIHAFCLILGFVNHARFVAVLLGCVYWWVGLGTVPAVRKDETLICRLAPATHYSRLIHGINRLTNGTNGLINGINLLIDGIIRLGPQPSISRIMQFITGFMS